MIAATIILLLKCVSTGTAVAGSDFTAAVGKVSFAAGQTSATITVSTLDDTTPEQAEMFTVSLFNASSNNVITSPATADVSIARNDDASGVISFQASSPSATIDEDASSRTASYVLQRARGAFGSVTVFWQVRIQNTSLSYGEHLAISVRNGPPHVSSNRLNKTARISHVNLHCCLLFSWSSRTVFR